MPSNITNSNDETRSGFELDRLRQFLNHGLMSDKASVVLDSLTDLDALLFDDTTGEIAEAAGDWEGTSKIVRCMKLWLHKQEIQEEALFCLHCLISSSSEETRASVVCQGGVEIIICTMKLYPDVADLQRGGCLALAGALSPPFSPTIQSLCSRFVKEWDGVSLVIKAMDKWPMDSAMQEAVICMLCRLMLDEDAKQELIKKDALDKVNRALKIFPSDERIKSQTTPFMKMMLKAMLLSKRRSVRFSLPTMEG